MTKTRNATSLSERLMGLLILITLIGICAWIFNRQFTFNPAITAISDAITDGVDSASTSSGGPLNLAALVPGGFKTSGPPEVFDPNSLFEKINGKADLYLSAGFVSLTCRRFSEIDGSAWMEAFIYDMGKPRQAFAVYSAQRREDAKEHELTELACSTANAIYFVHGRYYVEAVASTVTEGIAQGMNAFAKAFIESTPGKGGVMLRELALFPLEHAIEDSTILFMTDGFGFERFNNLFMTRYQLGASEVTGFLTVRDTPADAVDLAAAYCEFLIDNGGTYETPTTKVPGASVYNLFGTYEIIFNFGRVVAGVHQAETLEAADWLAAALHRGISESEQW